MRCRERTPREDDDLFYVGVVEQQRQQFATDEPGRAGEQGNAAQRRIMTRPNPARFGATGTALRLVDDVLLEPGDRGEDFALFLRRDVELVERGGQIPDRSVPILLGNAEPGVR